VVTVHKRLHQGDATLVAVFAQFARFGRIDGQGFLTEDVTAGVGRSPGPFGVAGVGKWVVHRVDVVVREQGFVGAVRPWNPAVVGEGPCALLVAGGNSERFVLRGLDAREHCGPSAVRRPENTESHGVTRTRQRDKPSAGRPR